MTKDLENQVETLQKRIDYLEALLENFIKQYAKHRETVYDVPDHITVSSIQGQIRKP
jgi:hypothetical protein